MERNWSLSGRKWRKVFNVTKASGEQSPQKGHQWLAIFVELFLTTKTNSFSLLISITNI
jgi:hypothetical protein